MRPNATGGFLFDTVTRQDPIDDERLTVDDNLEEFTPITGADLQHLKTESERLEATGKAVLACFAAPGSATSLLFQEWSQAPKGHSGGR